MNASQKMPHIYPDKYQEEIRLVLSQFPELADVHIHFMLAKRASVPYGTKPALSSCFSAHKKRVYVITILEEAKPPLEDALFKNLTHEMRLGVLAHELTHVIQFNRCYIRLSLLKMLTSFLSSSSIREIERAADTGAIDHGFGNALLAHAMYIRTIPGYVKQRPEINRNYLHPDEIRARLKKQRS